MPTPTYNPQNPPGVDAEEPARRSHLRTTKDSTRPFESRVQANGDTSPDEEASFRPEPDELKE